jgi:hypothetical protein
MSKAANQNTARQCASLLNVFVIVTLLIVNFSCKKEASRDQPYKDVLTSGTWRITSLDIGHIALGSGDTTVYKDSSLYQGYKLLFTTDGKVQVTDLNSVSSMGRWNEYSYEGLPEFYMFLEFLQDEYYYLNGNFTFLEYSSAQINFEIRSFGTVYRMTLLKF